MQGGLADGERLFLEPSESQAGAAETGAGVHLGPPRENQTDSAQPPKRRCLPENRSSGSGAVAAVCADVPGPPNETIWTQSRRLEWSTQFECSQARAVYTTPTMDGQMPIHGAQALVQNQATTLQMAFRVGSHEPTGRSVTLCRDTRAPGK